MSKIGDVFKVGQTAPVSGIYAAVHGSYHLQPHKVLCIKNEMFPNCRDCGIAAEFQLIEPFQHVLEHSAFLP